VAAPIGGNLFPPFCFNLNGAFPFFGFCLIVNGAGDFGLVCGLAESISAVRDNCLRISASVSGDIGEVAGDSGASSSGSAFSGSCNEATVNDSCGESQREEQREQRDRELYGDNKKIEVKLKAEIQLSEYMSRQ
jgi:hypothetical protein